jgi:hypothetical protein
LKAKIVAGNFRDLSYIAANLRPEDYAEIDCQFDEWSPVMLAYASMQGLSWVVTLDGNPEAAFGAQEHRQGFWIIWSWGTKRMARCVPTITRFAHGHLIPLIRSSGGWRAEARPLAANELACRWLERLGARRQGLLESYGKNGEDFILYEWVRSQFEDIDHVLPQAAAPSEVAADADRE